MSPVLSRFGPRALAAAACLALVALAPGGCGPGGGNNIAIPTEFGGAVKVPSGTPALGKPTLLTRAERFLFPEAMALTGLDAVDAGVEVRLYAVDRSGNLFGHILDTTTTAGDGSYAVTLPSWDRYDGRHPWVVAVGDPADGTLMRRLVDNAGVGAARDIDPASEAAVRMLLQDPGIPNLAEITPFEIGELNDQVNAATATVTGIDLADVIDLALEVARDDEGVQRRLINISSTPDNTRPLARAGIDFRMTTGDTISLQANAEDANGDLVSYRWTVDVAPDTSVVLRTPPIGRRLTFRADVDGTYQLRLVVTDINLAPSPPDFVTIIATTDPIQVTINDTTDAQGAMTASRNRLIYTTAVRDAATNANYTDVLLQPLSPTGPTGVPLRLLPPGATKDSHVLRTVEGHPAIAANDAMVTYSTDMASPGAGGGDFEVVGVSLARIGSPFYVTANTSFDTQPDVQCPSIIVCTFVWVNDADPTGTQIFTATYVDPGSGFAETARAQLTHDATDHFSPRLTQDGKWVVFTARDPVQGDLEIYRTLVDGSMANPEPLTDNAVNDDLPAPDRFGEAVVYRRGNAIWHLALDASGFVPGPLSAPVRVSGPRIQGTHPSVSADGTVVGFVGTTDLGTDLFSVLSDGSRLTQLTTDGTVSQPQVSADGSRILFRSARDGDHDFYLR